ncbi:InlB B-repeat-containing protein, partial [Prevotella sp. OH937_COT-195]|uniref:InlB B-repeat-containing protein n=1 Tax=Prevotella sp. OH937_COT-195 TaxID=2491051 RepID=UPI000FAF580C
MKKILFATLCGVLIMSLVSCGDDDEARTYYTVTFDADGGTPVPANQKVEEGKTATVPSPAPTKTGFVFVAWTTDGTN